MMLNRKQDENESIYEYVVQLKANAQRVDLNRYLQKSIQTKCYVMR